MQVKVLIRGKEKVKKNLIEIEQELFWMRKMS